MFFVEVTQHGNDRGKHCCIIRPLCELYTPCWAARVRGSTCCTVHAREFSPTRAMLVSCMHIVELITRYVFTGSWRRARAHANKMAKLGRLTLGRILVVTAHFVRVQRRWLLSGRGLSPRGSCDGQGVQEGDGGGGGSTLVLHVEILQYSRSTLFGHVSAKHFFISRGTSREGGVLYPMCSTCHILHPPKGWRWKLVRSFLSTR